MFSAIVEELGQIYKKSRAGKFLRLNIKADKTLKDTKIGDSIAVNGVCLTIVEIKNNIFSFDVMPETEHSTNLQFLRAGSKVNLERALKFGDRVSGHLVSGHIDCMGIVRKKGYIFGNFSFDIAVPEKFSKFIIKKGSIALDGISLTIAEKKGNIFSVYIIPHTVKNTSLGFLQVSDKVNIEFDIALKKVVK